MSEPVNTGGPLERSLEWLRFINPVTELFAASVRQEDLSGRSISGWMHLLPDTVLILEPFLKAGAAVRVGACNPDSTNETVVELLRTRGAVVYAGGDRSSEEYQDTLHHFAAAGPDVICDMGGELAEAAVKCGVAPKAGLEATITGLHRLASVPLNFPVFDWNSVPIKDALHNRFHVGDATWPAFTAMTGIGLFGCKVLVIGFGPVGRGVAERARNLGAIVMVAELDRVRSLEALHFGCEVVSLTDGLSKAEVVVTATGIDGVLPFDMLSNLCDGAILFNVGHSNGEIDVQAMSRLHSVPMKAGIQRHRLGDKVFYLLNRGSMVNLGMSVGLDGSDAFDPFAAIMVAGMHWILTGGADRHEAGVQPYPHELLGEVAAAALSQRQARVT